MSKFMGTPGPWAAYENENFCGSTIFYIAQEEGAPYTPAYSDVASTVSGEQPSIQKANACLIAAAPDLLEACQAFLEYHDAEGDDDMEMMLDYAAAVDLARDAIAKALGEQ